MSEIQAINQSDGFVCDVSFTSLLESRFALFQF